MKFLVAVAALACGLIAGAAQAQSGRYITPPPVVLSPDLAEPWVMQLRPGSKPLFRRTVREAALQAPEPAQPRRTDPRTAPVDPRFLPQTVSYDGPHGPGTIVIDTNERLLYLVERGGTARRYGVGVGRPGFEWAGQHRITRKAEWPDWRPPAEMRKRQPHLPMMMPGGPTNPLGARAMYLGSTLYRIHGTSEPWTIGSAVSSGCIRMRNEDVIDLYTRVGVGTKVIVM